MCSSSNFSIWPSIAAAMKASLIANPLKEFIRHADRSISYADAESLSAGLAASLIEFGVNSRDRVAVLMPNSIEHVVTLLACARIGAVQVPLNHEYQPDAIGRILDMVEPTVLITDASFASLTKHALASATVAPRVVLSDVDRVTSAPEERSEFERLCANEKKAAWQETPLESPFVFIMTSGTTGAAKAVEISHGFSLHLASEVVWHQEYVPSDVLFSPYPLFHGDAPLLTVMPALIAGCTAAIGRKFSASRFWDEIRNHKATVFDYMGAVLAILGKQPIKDNDKDHTVRLAWGGPAPANWKELEERFGIRIREVYGATECCLPIWESVPRARVDGTAGQVCEHHEVRIADELGVEVAPGEVGEILVRGSVPFSQMTQYYGNSEATIAAWRDLWYHTGDRGSIDAEGYFRFAGRSKDVIRRRGRNIGAEEIESVAVRLDGVIDAAAIAVPSELTEDDIKLVIQTELPWTATRLLDELVERLPRYMVPRYIEITQEMPRTPTGKVDKNILRQSWATTGTWDRESLHEIVDRAVSN